MVWTPFFVNFASNFLKPQNLLEPGKIKQESGKVKFEGWDFLTHVSTLVGMLDTSTRISDSEARNIVFRALMETGENGTITQEKLIGEISKRENLYLNSPPSRFVLAASISILNTLDMPKMNHNGCLIIFEKDLAEKYKKESQKILDWLGKSGDKTLTNIPSDYISVRVHVNERTPSAAASKTLNTLDIIRGIWNFVLTYRQTNLSFQARTTPKNKIQMGPIQSIHHIGGKLATTQYWYEPNYLMPIIPSALKGDPKKHIEIFRQVRQRLSKSPFRSDLEQAFIRYAVSLDQRDYHNAFLKMWSLLEFLTNSKKDTPYKIIIKRVTFLYHNHQLHRSILETLMQYRNEYVHHAKESDEVETHLNVLKGYVDFLLSFCLNNPFKFNSIAEIADFSDLPKEKRECDLKMKILEEQLENLKKASKFRDSK